jgi:hypothetical protein
MRSIVNNNNAKAISFLASIPCRIQIRLMQEVLLGPQDLHFYCTASLVEKLSLFMKGSQDKEM